jgi:hypothetical protein
LGDHGIQAERLAKFKIPPERFKKESNSLVQAGFSVEQADKLIIRRRSKNAVRAVLNHTGLLQQPYELTTDQIVRIASHDGGTKNLKAVHSAYQALKNLEFTADQIVSIVSHDGGSNNIEAVQSAYQALKNLEFTADQIVSIVSHNGGSKNIEAIQSAHQALKNLEFTADQIVSIASHGGGSNNIEAVQSTYQALKNLEFTADQIVSIASHGGGSKNIEAVQSAYQALKNLEFTADQIVSIASHNGGSKNIEAVSNNYAQFKALGYTSSALVKLVGKNRGSKNIINATLALPNQHEDNFLPSDISSSSEMADQLSTDLFYCDDDDEVIYDLNTEGTSRAMSSSSKRKNHPSDSKNKEATKKQHTSLGDHGIQAERLAKFKISSERFEEESNLLIQAGFSGEQADKLIIRKSSQNAVQAVLKNISLSRL